MGKGKGRICGRIGMLFVCSAMIMLGGCEKAVETWASGKLEEDILENTAYLDDEAYKEYQTREANGTLPEVNVEQPENLEVTPERTGKIKVTFANNNLLDILYFTDAACTNPIDPENCYLNPEDKIYASEPRCKSEYGNMYSFLEYRVYEIDSTGKRMQVEGVSEGEENLVYQIPMLMEGNELSIVPVGQYTDRTIMLHDYTVNEKNEEVEESGTWTINNTECQNTEYTFSSLVTYQISYQYDPEEYYFVDSTPKCYYPKTASEGKGNIIFYEEKNFLNPNEIFSVKLHKYLSAEIDNSKGGGIESIFVGNEEIDIWQNKKKNEQKEKIILDTLRCGDIVTIITKKECKLVPSMFELEGEQPKKQTNGCYKYTFTVPDVAEGSYKFSVKEWIEKDVKLEVGKMDDAVEKVIKETFKDGESLLTIKTDSNSYTLEKCKKEKSIPLAESEDLIINISEKLPEGIKVHIVVDRDENKVFDINKDTPKEQYEIKLSYEEVNSLNISVKNEGLMKNAGTTSDLAVTLDKNVGTNPVFTIKQVEGETMVAETGYSTSGAKLYEGKVDANKDIVLSGQMQLDVNTAIKLEITKEVGGTEIRYCTGRTFEEIITTKEGTEYCGAIEVNISLVDVVTYKPDAALENGTIELRFADTDGHKILANELLEENRKVIVTVKAKNGYYIEGSFGYKSDISSDSTTYEKEMKFSDYVKDIEKIVTKNPIKKLVVVTLSVTSPKSVGKVTYELNGDDSKIVSATGTYSFKERDEIKITWDVSGTGYKLVNEWFTVPGVNWTPNNKMEKETVTIKITQEHSGTTIYAEDIEKFTELKLEKEED